LITAIRLDAIFERSMKALRFSFSYPRALLSMALGRMTNSTDTVVYGVLSSLALSDVPEPALRGPDWVKLDVLMCGICGTDVAGLTYRTSPVLEPFLSLPAVFGHEVLGRVVEVGSNVSRVKVGDRVVIDPSISCLVRGWPVDEQCPSCRAGLPTTCARGGDEGGAPHNGAPLARGLLIGVHADLPGGFGPRMVAHDSQVYPISEALDDARAVLTEPLSVAVHAVLQTKVDPAAAALVIGSGPIALSAVWALRALGHQGPLVAQTKRANEAALAVALGASETVTPGKSARDALLATGAKRYKPITGKEVFAGGGFPVVFDCVGSRDSLTQALRFISPRGKIVMLGCAGALDDIDLTHLWSREVELVGYLGYGMETWRGMRLHTFEVTHQLLAETNAPVEKIVTHRFPLPQYRDAFRAAIDRQASGAVKVVLTPA
jgi:L-iditol 2-dehydrogenase